MRTIKFVQSNPRTPPRHRGSAILIVIWSLTIGVLIASSVQIFAYRQAVQGAEAVQRIQARWAARAGLEQTISAMADFTESPDPNNAWAMTRAFDAVADGATKNASWIIRHHIDGQTYLGPMDEHAKLNINGNARQFLLFLLDSPPVGVPEAIEDWIDEDDEITGLVGAERDWYNGFDNPYNPRNGPVQSMAEIELIAGIDPIDLRGEDWNLNNRLDASENDALMTLPEDEPDGILNAGWSQRITPYSRGWGATQSGLPRLVLAETLPEDLAERINISIEQAEQVIASSETEGFTLENLITNPINSSGDDVELLTDDEIGRILSECSMFPRYQVQYGKLNINTVPEDLLSDMFPDDPMLVDEIIRMRRRSQGITSMMNLLDGPDMEREDVQQMSFYLDTSSNVFTISSIGRSDLSGLEVEIIAVVDRSTLPIRILEYREE
ncbi:MAG: type II secretion system protein GspK [Phycisphaerales bacterium]|nr:type II secretion system protein GspK [Phycisphaerales bacterium]